MNEDTDIETKNLNGTYKINEKGKQLNSETNEINVEFDGKSNFEGYITITNYKVTSTDIRVDDFSINYIDGEVSISKKKEVEKSILIKGQEFNSVIKSLVNGSGTTYSFTDEKVISIDFYSNGLLPSGHTTETLELLPKDNISTTNDITAYNDNGKIYIISDKLISFNEDCSWMFYKLKSVSSIIFRKFDTSSTKNMQYLFWQCSSLTNLDVSGFDTSLVNSMGSMFQGCRLLKIIDVSNFNTSQVTNMNRMFNECSALTKLNVSNFNTKKVTNMAFMFAGCSTLTNLNVSNFDTSKVENMEYMFYQCRNLEFLDLSNFNTTQVINMNCMFLVCTSLMSLDLSNWDTSNVTIMNHMFNGTNSLNEIKIGCDWVTSTNNINMFNGSKYTQEQFNILIEQRQSNCPTTEVTS